MKVLKRCGAVFDRVIDIMFYAASGLSLVIFVSVCAELFMRNLFNRPLMWTVETAEYAMLFITFLGAAWLLREEGHVKIDILVVVLKSRSQSLLNSITYLFFGVIVCAVLVYYGTWSTWLHYQKGSYTFTALELLKWPFLAIIPLGSFFVLIQFIRSAYRYWKSFKSYEETE
jgi:C4-dicarboxylate transporter DctQ subunit